MTNPNIEAFSDRVSLLIGENNSASDFARKIGVSDTVVRKWRDGKSDPSRENLVAIARMAKVNIAWLAAGEGPMRGGGRGSA